jgi:hypothetical protein
MDDNSLEPGSLTWRQALALRRLLPEGTRTDHWTRQAAATFIQLHDPDAPWRQEPASDRQKRFLQLRGLWREGLTKGEASNLIREVKEHPRS